MALHYLDRWTGCGARRGRQANYSTAEVEVLLGLMWTGATSSEVMPPDPDMPRQAGNPAESGNVEVGLIDVRRAWLRAQLLPEERSTLFLLLGCGWLQAEVAEAMDVSQSSVSRWRESGLAAVTDAANGVVVAA